MEWASESTLRISRSQFESWLLYLPILHPAVTSWESGGEGLSMETWMESLASGSWLASPAVAGSWGVNLQVENTSTSSATPPPRLPFLSLLLCLENRWDVLATVKCYRHKAYKTRSQRVPLLLKKKSLGGEEIMICAVICLLLSPQ